MSGSCYIRGCTQEFKKFNSDESIRLFKLPSKASDDTRSQWLKNIPNREELPFDFKKCRLCQFHFDEKFILKEGVVTMNGKIVYRALREKWGLQPGAVPTIFSNKIVRQKLNIDEVDSQSKRKLPSTEPGSNATNKRRKSDIQIEVATRRSNRKRFPVNREIDNKMNKMEPAMKTRQLSAISKEDSSMIKRNKIVQTATAEQIGTTMMKTKKMTVITYGPSNIKRNKTNLIPVLSETKKSTLPLVKDLNIYKKSKINTPIEAIQDFQHTEFQDFEQDETYQDYEHTDTIENFEQDETHQDLEHTETQICKRNPSTVFEHFILERNRIILPDQSWSVTSSPSSFIAIFKTTQLHFDIVIEKSILVAGKVWKICVHAKDVTLRFNTEMVTSIDDLNLLINELKDFNG